MLNTGRSGQPVQGRRTRRDRLGEQRGGQLLALHVAVGGGADGLGAVRQQAGHELRQRRQHPARHQFADAGDQIVAVKRRGDAALVQDGADLLLHQVRLAFLDQQHLALVLDEIDDLLVAQRVDDVQLQHADGRIRDPVLVGQAQIGQHAHHGVEHRAVGDDADWRVRGAENLIQAVLDDVLARLGQAVAVALQFLTLGVGRQRVARRILDAFLQLVDDVVLADAVVAYRHLRVGVRQLRAQQQGHHAGRYLGQLEALARHAQQQLLVGARIDHDDAGLHGPGSVRWATVVLDTP